MLNSWYGPSSCYQWRKHVCSKQLLDLLSAQERSSQKKLSLSDEYQYTSVRKCFRCLWSRCSWKISKMPDDKNYSLKTVKGCSPNSDNVATNIFSYYKIQSHDKAFQKSVDKAARRELWCRRSADQVRAAGIFDGGYDRQMEILSIIFQVHGFKI